MQKLFLPTQKLFWKSKWAIVTTQVVIFRTAICNPNIYKHSIIYLEIKVNSNYFSDQFILLKLLEMQLPLHLSTPHFVNCLWNLFNLKYNKIIHMNISLGFRKF